MEIIKQFLAERGIYPKVDFDDKEPHTFKVLKAKVVDYDDGTNSLKLLVEENGENKLITSPSILVEIQNCQEGDVYKIQLKWGKIGGKPFKKYEAEKIEFADKKATKEEKPVTGKLIKDKKDEIPIIDEEDIGDPPF